MSARRGAFILEPTRAPFEEGLPKMNERPARAPLSAWRRLPPLMISVALAACAPSLARIPLPASEMEAATVLSVPAGTDEIRIWGDERPAWVNEFLSAPDSEVKAKFPDIYGRPHSYLALSGGGLNGAYGAGMLVGWTASGKRPQFTMVTGISTGSLIAPFAFLGSAYDRQLEEIYTKYSTDDLVKRRSLLGMVSQASAADVTPLKSVIAHYVDANLIAAIAAEHRKGRRLFVGTTNLDASRPVMWNIGAIANSSDPGAANLIREVLLASASIPGAFPPVLIHVNADGKAYDELHVDGGTTTQVFVYPTGIDWNTVPAEASRPGQARPLPDTQCFAQPDLQAGRAQAYPDRGTLDFVTHSHPRHRRHVSHLPWCAARRPEVSSRLYPE